MGIKKRTKKEEIRILIGQLEELEDYISDFWSFLPLPILYVNLSHIILDADQAFFAFSGYRGMEELAAKDIEILFKEKKKVEELKKETMGKGGVEGKEMIFLTRQKKEIDTIVFTKARRSLKGDIIGYFMSVYDISELKGAQENLQKRIKDLEDFNRLVVGRELKMVELKKEIEELRRLEEQRKGDNQQNSPA